MISNPETNIKNVFLTFKKLKQANGNRILRKPKCYTKSTIFSFSLLLMPVNGTISNPVTQIRSLEIVLDQWFSAQLNIRTPRARPSEKLLNWSAHFNSAGDSNVHPRLRTTVLQTSFALNTHIQRPQPANSTL